MNRADDDAVLALAGRLSATAGGRDAIAVERLVGGRNNRVFKVATAGGPPLALKLYHVDPRDPRDRLAREWEFLDYVWARGVRCVPQPLARDATAHAGLYSFLPGRKLSAEEVGGPQVEAALDFILAINAAPREVGALAPASEACFSLAQHLAAVDQRVSRLGTLDDAAHAGAAAFVRERLKPAWAAVQRRVEARAEQLGMALDAPIDAVAVCISPSDFGFHNVLADGSELGFVDFEYAGRDDPAKLASDLFSCPEVPAPVEHHQAFVGGLAKGLGLDAGFERRCGLLLDACRVKWACIMLGDFLPVGQARRAFSEDSTAAEVQLARAEAKLGEIAAGRAGAVPIG